MTQLTITDKLRNLNMTLRSSDLQSDNDLDSIRNSCDVFGEEYVRDIYSKVCRAKDKAREEVLELRLKLKDLEASLARRKEVGAADLYSSVVLRMISRDG